MSIQIRSMATHKRYHIDPMTASVEELTRALGPDYRMNTADTRIAIERLSELKINQMLEGVPHGFGA